MTIIVVVVVVPFVFLCSSGVVCLARAWDASISIPCFLFYVPRPAPRPQGDEEDPYTARSARGSHQKGWLAAAAARAALELDALSTGRRCLAGQA
jgi:hypothetical protein